MANILVMKYFIFYGPDDTWNLRGPCTREQPKMSSIAHSLREWLAHLASHSPLNTRVNYAVGSNPTGSLT